MKSFCMVCKQLKEMHPRATTCTDCISSGFKWCKHCKRILPVTDFTKGNSGYWHICKNCYAAQKAAERSTPKGRDAARKAYQAWYATPHGRQHEKNRTHARKTLKGPAGYLSVDEWEHALAFFGNACAYCGNNGKLTQDHIIPLSKGGKNIASNVIPACKHCNSSKNASDMLKWYSKQPFYSLERYDKIVQYTKGGVS